MAIDTKFIGKTYPTHTYEVGKEKIKEYAKAIKNPDPHYLDDDFAKNRNTHVSRSPTRVLALLFDGCFTDTES